jgi:hypothetical protein
MGSPELEIAQPRPRNYSEYMGGLSYSDDSMDEGDELPPVEMGMETEEMPLPSVPVESEFYRNHFVFIVF